MRSLLAAICIAVLLGGLATATESLEGDIASTTGIARPISASLQGIAAQRALQIVTDFSHDRKPSYTAEVLAWNSGYSDPVSEAVAAWMASPDHRAILVDPYWNVIGCGSTTAGGTFYAVCELIHSTGPVPSEAPSPPPAPTRPLSQARGPVVLLPNTATR